MNIKMEFKINKDLFEDVENEVRTNILEDVGKEVIANVKAKVPVVTGNLYNHTGFTAEDGHLEFNADTAYADKVDAIYHFMNEVEFADYEEMIAERIRGYLGD